MTRNQIPQTGLARLKASEFEVCQDGSNSVRFQLEGWEYTAIVPRGFILDRAGANWLLRAVRELYFHDQLTVTLPALT